MGRLGMIRTSAQRRLAALAAACLVMTALGSRTEATEEHPAFKEAKAPESQLVVTRSVTLPNGTEVTRAKQQVSGLDVLGAEAIFVESSEAGERLYDDSTKANVRPNATKEKVTRAEAIAIATDANGVQELRDRASAHKALSKASDGTLVWVVVLPSGEPLADFETLIDATTGDVLSTRDVLAHSTGTAKIYDPSAAVEKNESPTSLVDGDDADTAELTALRTTVSLPRIKSGQTCLKGKWVEAVLYDIAKKVCKSSLDWSSTTRSKDAFEALMAYFHIDRAQKYIQSLGFKSSNLNAINDRVQKVLVDAIDDDNSFYSPGTRKLTFGIGGVDDAEDADVIIHEYGHSIQDNQVPGYGTGLEGRALGEGFGDYLAAAASTELSGAPAPWNVCIFDWDGISWGSGTPKCGRRADIADTTLAARKTFCGPSNIHCVGQIWSTSLYKLRTAIGDDSDGKNAMDRIVLFSHFLELTGVDFAAAANAVLCADEAWYPAGTADDCVGQSYTAIHNEFVARGFIS
jgi:hypothetical protein